MRVGACLVNRFVLYGLEKMLIRIVGRRLDELSNGMSTGRIRWLAECDPRGTEASPAVLSYETIDSGSLCEN